MSQPSRDTLQTFRYGTIDRSLTLTLLIVNRGKTSGNDSISAAFPLRVDPAVPGASLAGVTGL